MNRGTTAVLLLVLAAAFAYQYNTRSRIAPFAHEEQGASEKPARRIADEKDHFTCEGKTRCAQMTSCAEAKFYVANCPGTQMDGDHDGIPCESQWCSDED